MSSFADKPPIADLQYFLDFQSNKLWAPVHNDHPLGPSSIRSIPTPSLQFCLMGPKLYVNTAQVCNTLILKYSLFNNHHLTSRHLMTFLHPQSQVIVERKPITGMRLHLEGKKNDRLAQFASITLV